MCAFQSHPSCSWLVFIPVFVPLDKPKVNDRTLFSLVGEVFNTILGLVAEFRQIQSGKKVKMFTGEDNKTGAEMR